MSLSWDECFYIYNPVVMNLHLFSDLLFRGAGVKEWVMRAAGTALGAKWLPWFPDNRFARMGYPVSRAEKSHSQSGCTG